MPPRELSETGLDHLLTDIIVWPVRIVHQSSGRESGSHGSAHPAMQTGMLRPVG